MQSFHDLGVSAPVTDALEARGIHTPFAIQARVLPDALAGLDVLAKSPTGSGKTLAFALPLVERIDAADRGPVALVLVPTRELASQVTEELEAVGRPRGLRVTAVYGGTKLGPSARSARESHVVVATPGRLNDLVDRRMLSLEAVTVLVLDEADRMLDMGFKPQVDAIVRRLPSARQTMFFSATLDGEVGELARLYTTAPVRHEAELPAEADYGEIEHRFVPVTAENKLDTLTELLAGERGLALIFVRTKRGADRLARKLKAAGVDAAAMHGDMTQGARERALSRFETGKVTTLVATDVAARGLDLDEITHVVNYDPPTEHTGYVHRVGRTGRAGRSGIGVTLVLPEQQADVSRVAARLGHREQYESTGLKSAPAKVVYSSRRGRSKWGPTRPRRKI